jgi:formylglycine-generating enzyme required for sulfatase activity
MARVMFGSMAIVAMACAGSSGAQPCNADLNADRVVDGGDLGALLGAWGPCGTCAADLNLDGSVDADDLGRLLGAWGRCPPVVPGWATLVEGFPDARVVTDPVLRLAILESGLAWRVRDTATQIEMLLVPPGQYEMGCTQPSLNHDCFDWELPEHSVTLTQPFYLGRHEVTQSQWQSRMGSNPSQFQGTAHPEAPSRPVERVSWHDVQTFMAATGMRLPTEAEWEFACRAGTQTAFFNGSNDDATLPQIAWRWPRCSPGPGPSTSVVGRLLPNRLGFHDMLGNAWEWVADWYGDHWAAPQTDPTGPETGETRVIRGGGWGLDVEYVRSSNRTGMPPGTVSQFIGFRVARNP